MEETSTSKTNISSLHFASEYACGIKCSQVRGRIHRVAIDWGHLVARSLIFIQGIHGTVQRKKQVIEWPALMGIHASRAAATGATFDVTSWTTYELCTIITGRTLGTSEEGLENISAAEIAHVQLMNLVGRKVFELLVVRRPFFNENPF